MRLFVFLCFKCLWCVSYNTMIQIEGNQLTVTKYLSYMFDFLFFPISSSFFTHILIVIVDVELSLYVYIYKLWYLRWCYFTQIASNRHQRSVICLYFNFLLMLFIQLLFLWHDNIWMCVGVYVWERVVVELIPWVCNLSSYFVII